MKPEDLELIERMAGALMEPSRIARAIEMAPDTFKLALMDAEGEISKAYYKGKIMAELKLRESILQLAFRGSSPAQAEALKLLTTQNMSE